MKRTAILLSLLWLGLTGCDDVAGFDVYPSGELLVLADARGRCPLNAGQEPLHLLRYDPATGQAVKLTQEPGRRSWPTVCGQDALYVSKGQELILLEAKGGRRVLCRAPKGQRLFQPRVAPGLGHVSILVAKELGAPGELRILELSDPETPIHRVPGALLGGLWRRDGLYVPRASAPRERFASGPGQVLRIGRKLTQRVVYEGPLPALVPIQARGEQLLAPLHAAGLSGPLTLTPLQSGTPARGAKSFELWPASQGQRLLFTASEPSQPALHGQLRMAEGEGSRVIPTEGPVASPRWLTPGRVAFLSVHDRLVTQGLKGQGRVDATSALAAAFTSTTTSAKE